MKNTYNFDFNQGEFVMSGGDVAVQGDENGCLGLTNELLRVFVAMTVPDIDGTVKVNKVHRMCRGKMFLHNFFLTFFQKWAYKTALKSPHYEGGFFMKEIQHQKKYIRTCRKQGIARLRGMIKSYWTDTDTYILRGRE